MNRLTFATILHFAFMNLCTGQNIYDFEHSLEYAKNLSVTGKHQLAAREYERLCYFYPQNDSILYLLMQSYRKSKQYVAGIDYVERQYDPFAISAQIANEYATFLLLNRDYKKLGQMLNDNSHLSDNNKELLTFQSLLML